jgi:hypothetical protein
MCLRLKSGLGQVRRRLPTVGDLRNGHSPRESNPTLVGEDFFLQRGAPSRSTWHRPQGAELLVSSDRHRHFDADSGPRGYP